MLWDNRMTMLLINIKLYERVWLPQDPFPPNQLSCSFEFFQFLLESFIIFGENGLEAVIQVMQLNKVKCTFYLCHKKFFSMVTGQVIRRKA